MSRIVVFTAVSAVLTAVIGYLLLPLLRALKAGKAVCEIGPTWHNNKVGTPIMGGLMFIISTVICMILNLFSAQDYTGYYTLALALCFGLVGFLDDFFKVKFRRDLGLTALQKAMLQMAVSALYIYLLYKRGVLCNQNGLCNLYIPFTDTCFEIHPLVYVFFAMFVMMGCVNAVNLTDGVDGLCCSVTIPVMAFFTVAAVAKQRLDLALLPACLAGALAAYLFYNWHPAKGIPAPCFWGA